MREAAASARQKERSMNAKYDILGIGNAIVDVLVKSDEAFLLRENIQKGSMTLIDEARAQTLSSLTGHGTVMSGGSGANTVVGAASLGARTAFFGKVKDDGPGRHFAGDIKNIGVHFPTSPSTAGAATARCFVFVTPDGERTMSTYLGACQNLSAADLDEQTIEASAITYLEGYLWDPPAAKDAFIKASAVARRAGRKVALTLSDSFCVDRYRSEFLELIRSRAVDIVFANQHELKSLYTTGSFDSAKEALREEGVLGVVTCSELGSVVVTEAGFEDVPAFPVSRVVDTTGAGDLFAAGFLAGLAKNKDHVTCARLGALAASEIIQHIGARPQVSLRELAGKHGIAI